MDKNKQVDCVADQSTKVPEPANNAQKQFKDTVNALGDLFGSKHAGDAVTFNINRHAVKAESYQGDEECNRPR